MTSQITSRADGGLRAYRKSVRRRRGVLAALLAAVLVLFAASVAAGTSSLSVREALLAVFGGGSEQARLVVWSIRMPRAAAAAVAGAGLAAAGCVMQSCLENPLASPSTLGVSSAAALGANLAIIGLGAGTVTGASGSVAIQSPYLVALCAFACSLGAVGLILAISRLRGFSPASIVLTGTALSALCSAGTTLLQYFGDETQIASAVFWTFGDLGRVSWSENAILAAVTAGCLLIFLLMRWSCNALWSGEETARGLGVDASRVRLLGLVTASLLTAVCVSFMGMIGFLGLVGPQLARRIIGGDHRFLIPASALSGAALLLLSDVCARTVVPPVVLPVGAITSLLGAPAFFILLLKGTRPHEA